MLPYVCLAGCARLFLETRGDGERRRVEDIVGDPQRAGIVLGAVDQHRVFDIVNQNE